MQKNILIKAYVNLNLGDDLFIEILCRRYPEHQFFLIGTGNKTKYLKKINNLKIINRIPLVDSILNKINTSAQVNHIIERFIAKKCDAVINIGGSIFIEPQRNWHVKTKEFENLIRSSKRFFVMGSNFGPYEDENYYQEYYKNFSMIDDVCFRDKYSYNQFKNLPNTRLASDIVFSLDSSSVKGFSNEEYIVISVMDLSWRNNLKKYTESYEKSIVEISEKLISNEKKVVLMSFCKSEGDENSINRILNNFSDDNLTSYFYDGNISEALSILKSSEAVVATRFHSLVLGWVFNKPVFPFIYSGKTLNLLNDNNYMGYSLPINELENIDINKVIYQILQGNIIDTAPLYEDANKHFLKTDEFLFSSN